MLRMQAALVGKEPMLSAMTTGRRPRFVSTPASDSTCEGKLPNAKHWSRRKDLNTSSADYNSAALSLSYAGL